MPIGLRAFFLKHQKIFYGTETIVYYLNQTQRHMHTRVHMHAFIWLGFLGTLAIGLSYQWNIAKFSAEMV